MSEFLFHSRQSISHPVSISTIEKSINGSLENCFNGIDPPFPNVAEGQHHNTVNKETFRVLQAHGMPCPPPNAHVTEPACAPFQTREARPFPARPSGNNVVATGHVRSSIIG